VGYAIWYSAQLFEEMAKVQSDEQRQTVQEQIIIKLRRRLSRLPEEARAEYQATAGETPEQTLARLESAHPAEMAQWVQARPGLGRILDWGPTGPGGQLLPISKHDDEVVSVTRGYGAASKPEDFLDSFNCYRRHSLHINKTAGSPLTI